MLLPIAHPELQIAYPPQTLACILACVVLTEQRLGSAAPVFWEIAAHLDRLSGRALMEEEDLPSSLVPESHHGWIRPTISCDLPRQLPGTCVPSSLRNLVLCESVLMSRKTSDAQMAIRDTADAGMALSPLKRTDDGQQRVTRQVGSLDLA